MVHPSAIVIKRCTRFSTQVRIQILHLSLCIIFSRSIYISYFIRSCCEYYLTVFHMSHFLTLFVKLLTLIVGFKLTTRDDLLSIDSNTLPMCHGRLRTCIVICIFMFKFPLIFLNSEHAVCNLMKLLLHESRHRTYCNYVLILIYLLYD